MKRLSKEDLELRERADAGDAEALKLLRKRVRNRWKASVKRLHKGRPIR